MTANAHGAGRQPSRLLEVMHVANTSVRFKPFETVFAQGDSCTGVMYIQAGRVTLTTTSHQGRAAVVGSLAAGAFFGEGALAGHGSSDFWSGTAKKTGACRCTAPLLSVVLRD